MSRLIILAALVAGLFAAPVGFAGEEGKKAGALQQPLAVNEGLRETLGEVAETKENQAKMVDELTKKK